MWSHQSVWQTRESYLNQSGNVKTMFLDHTNSMETCMFFFGWLSTLESMATAGIHWVEFFLSLSVKLQNGDRDKKMSPEPTSIKH